MFRNYIHQLFKMTIELVLIGSRALNHWLSQRQIDELQTDYDFVGTYSGAFKWLGSLQGDIQFDKVEYLLDHQSHDKDIIHDLSHWKYFDGSLGINIYNQKLKPLSKIIKLKGHTNSLKFEIEIVQVGSSGELILELAQDDQLNNLYVIGDLELLEVIKTSHLIFPFNWCQHMDDLMLIRSTLGRQLGGRIKRADQLTELLIHRRLEHYLRLGVPGANLNLNKMNDDFLENESHLYIDKYIKHDDLHLRVMFKDKPAYSDLRLDQSKAMMDMQLFNQASFQVRLNCVREEAMVIALERYLLPERETEAQIAYTKALIRVCTTLTKGWFREFAVDVYYLVKDLNVDLMQLKISIRKEHADRLEQQKLTEAKAIADKKAYLDQYSKSTKTSMIKHCVNVIKNLFTNEAEVCQLSYTHGLQFRLDNLLPLIFSQPKELQLAQQMIVGLKLINSYRHNQYGCYLPKYGIDIVFSADTEYEHKNGGWCENYNHWHAYVMAMTGNQYRKKCSNGEDCNLLIDYRQIEHLNIFDDSDNVDDDNDSNNIDGYGYNYYNNYNHNYNYYNNYSLNQKETNSYTRLAFNMSTSADDSFSRSPSVDNLWVKSLDDLSQNPIATSDFLMRFILCVIYPPEFTSGGQNDMPNSKVHFLYPIWVDTIAKPSHYWSKSK